MSTCVSDACFQTSASMTVAESNFIYTGHVSLRFGENGCNLQDLFPVGIDINVSYEYDDQAVLVSGSSVLHIPYEELTVNFTISANMLAGNEEDRQIIVRFNSTTLDSISECAPLILMVKGRPKEGCLEDFFKENSSDCGSFFEYNILDS